MLRIGMIGAGHIAEVHAENLAKIDDVRVAATFDSVPEEAEAMARRYDAAACPDLDAVLGMVDAVYICTPPKFHAEAAIRAADAGLAVFCEKPLTTTIEDAEAVQAAVERSGIAFMVGFNFRFMPHLARLKELVGSGELGEIYSFWGMRLLWSPHPPPNWRTDPRFLCGMTIESLSHDFDFLRWVAGDVASVMGKVGTSRGDLAGYDNIIAAVMTLQAGGTATIQASWASHVGMTHYGVIGSRGSAACGDGVVRWRAEGQASETLITCDRPEDKVPSHQRETEHFIECLRAGQAPLTGVEDGVATVRISHAVLQSSREERVVRLD